nr:ABC transporter permease [Anaerolineae bacterium]
MALYITRRSFSILLTIWLAVSLTFLAMQIVPGDPAQAALSQSTATDDMIQSRREALGLDQPLHIQYARFLGGLLQGDLGVSWSAGQPVAVLMQEQLRPTAMLALFGLVVAVGVGVVLGLLMSISAGSLFEPIAQTFTALLLALPVMFVGTLAIWIFAVILDLLPATGQGTFCQLILPGIVVGLSGAGGIARAVDAGVRSSLEMQFVRVAYGKGLSRLAVYLKHALRVGILPVIDITALQFAYLLGGAVVTETVFSRQGIGRLLVNAVLAKDFPVIQGIVVLAALVYGVVHLAADIAHAWADPRNRLVPGR